MIAVLQKFIDQGISVNTSYNPQHYENEEIPESILIKDIVNFYKYGGKQLYYCNVFDNAGEQTVQEFVGELNDEIDCEGCVI